MNKLLLVIVGVIVGAGVLSLGYTLHGSSQRFGGTTNLDSLSLSGTLTLADIQMAGYRTSSLNQATTTICASQSTFPTAATSTLVGGSILLTVSSTTASTVVVAKASTAYATTTLLNSIAVAANAQTTLNFLSTTTGSTQNYVFGPTDYLVVSMQGGGGTFSPTGVCTAMWRSAI